MKTEDKHSEIAGGIAALRQPSPEQPHPDAQSLAAKLRDEPWPALTVLKPEQVHSGHTLMVRDTVQTKQNGAIFPMLDAADKATVFPGDDDWQEQVVLAVCHMANGYTLIVCEQGFILRDTAEGTYRAGGVSEFLTEPSDLTGVFTDAVEVSWAARMYSLQTAASCQIHNRLRAEMMEFINYPTTQKHIHTLYCSIVLERGIAGLMQRATTLPDLSRQPNF